MVGASVGGAYFEDVDVSSVESGGLTGTPAVPPFGYTIIDGYFVNRAVDCAATGLGADLHNCDLTGADLSGANLQYSNLSGANLTNANLAGTDLYYADLHYADLTGADLTGTNLSNAFWYSTTCPNGDVQDTE